MSKNKEIEKDIESLGSTYCDWEYVEEILESLEDAGCLTGIGKRFRNHIWKKYVKC